MINYSIHSVLLWQPKKSKTPAITLEINHILLGSYNKENSSFSLNTCQEIKESDHWL